MKLRQNEYCHNCRTYQDFEFESDVLRQVILCPKCGHEHYREIDDRTETMIRMKPRELKPVSWYEDGDIPMSAPLIETEEVVVKKGLGITQRRWGQDPRQNG